MSDFPGLPSTSSLSDQNKFLSARVSLAFPSFSNIELKYRFSGFLCMCMCEPLEHSDSAFNIAFVFSFFPSGMILSHRKMQPLQTLQPFLN